MDDVVVDPPKSPLTTNFLAWVHDAKPGAKYVYHIGLLGYDRYENPALDELANSVYDTGVAGLITPIQIRTTFARGLLKGHRKDDNDPRYIYVATRTRKRVEGGMD